MENKKERFKRLAAYRTNEILKRLRILGNCSNRSAYEYTEEDINKIFSEIEKMNYKLYQVKDTNGIMQYIFIKMIIANNIVEAEYLFDADMTVGNEYVITIMK